MWLVLVGFVALVLVVYGISRASSAGEVLGSVTADQTQLGGLDAGAAESALVELETDLGSSPATFRVEGTELELAPLSVGFNLDERAMVEAALAIGRSGNPVGEFAWWISHLFGSTEIPVEARIDPAALDLVLVTWDTEAIGSPPFPGAITIEGTEVIGESPRSGRQIDRNQAPNIVLAQASTSQRVPTDLPVIEQFPTLTIADIQAAVRTGELLLAGPITLRNPERDRQIIFSIGQLAAALRPLVGETSVDFTFDPEVFAEISRTSAGRPGRATGQRRVRGRGRSRASDPRKQRDRSEPGRHRGERTSRSSIGRAFGCASDRRVSGTRCHH